jgi:hypothetical protein
VTDIIESVPKPKQTDDVQQLAAHLVERARAEGVDLVGPGGLLTGLTKTVLETALGAAMAEHLGYDKHDPAGRTGGNSRNGTRSKTVLTEIGPVPIEVPRDRDGSFEPVIVRKRQRRLDGIDQLVLSLTARGLTTGERVNRVYEPDTIEPPDREASRTPPSCPRTDHGSRTNRSPRHTPTRPTRRCPPRVSTRRLSCVDEAFGRRTLHRTAVQGKLARGITG